MQLCQVWARGIVHQLAINLVIDPTDHRAVSAVITALRTGRITADFSPPAVATLIEAMWETQRALNAERNDLEQLALTMKTGAAARNDYARGFRAAQTALAAYWPDDENFIYGLEPDIVDASRMDA